MPVIEQTVRDEVLVDLPDTQAFVQRSSLLNFGFDGGRAINVDLSGNDINVLSEIAMQSMGIINEALPGAQVTRGDIVVRIRPA